MSLQQDGETRILQRNGDDWPVICDTGFDTTPLPAHENVGKDFLPVALLEHPKYRIFGRCGSGGMGVVYRSEHRLMGRIVALKVIRPRLLQVNDAVDRFRREVKAASMLAHPNIVATYDAEETQGVHFLVMEFVEGRNVAAVIAEQGPLTVETACDFALQTAQGLEHIHERGMVHRDVKPQNLMLTPQGAIKILDFDLSKFPFEIEGDEPSTPYAGHLPRESGCLTSASASFGTPDYVAPEQAADARSTDIRGDIYALGMTLYFLLTGRPPFPGKDILDKLRGHAERSPRPISHFRDDVPKRLVNVIAKMTAKHPADRFHAPHEVVQALRPFTPHGRMGLDLRRLRNDIRAFQRKAKTFLAAKSPIPCCFMSDAETTVLDLPALALSASVTVSEEADRARERPAFRHPVEERSAFWLRVPRRSASTDANGAVIESLLNRRLSSLPTLL